MMKRRPWDVTCRRPCVHACVLGLEKKILEVHRTHFVKRGKDHTVAPLLW